MRFLGVLRLGLVDADLRRHLIVLATTAGVAPFVGLFGTVWGIMKAFSAMSLTGSASISSVAPGVSAALTTTVAGLAVAIPALVGYNYLMNDVRNLTQRMENFSSEFLPGALTKSNLNCNNPHARIINPAMNGRNPLPGPEGPHMPILID